MSDFIRIDYSIMSVAQLVTAALAGDRATLVAYYLEEQSMLGMAEHFGAPVGTIKRRLHTARQRLAEACQDLAAC